ncbi:MAG: 50S ribosomal protein L22 [Patescibacteria group bacterium]|jgi:large subunit ribosomal protein L22
MATAPKKVKKPAVVAPELYSATLRHLRISSRKVRLVANLIRGKAVLEAQNILTHLAKGSTGPLRKLLDSAVANAKQAGEKVEGLHIAKITADMAPRLERYRPRAMGRAALILKHASHITLSVAHRDIPVVTPVAKAKAEKQPASVTPKAPAAKS